jgi:hypothetical protein
MIVRNAGCVAMASKSGVPRLRTRRRRHRHVNELGVGEQLNADHVDFP